MSVGDGALVDASPAHESADVDASSGKVASLWRPAFAVPAACGGLCDATRVLSMTFLRIDKNEVRARLSVISSSSNIRTV